jgi:hypothetical protein
VAFESAAVDLAGCERSRNPFQFEQHVASGLPPLVRILCQTAFDEMIESRRQRRRRLDGDGGSRIKMGRGQAGLTVAGECPLAGPHLVQQCAQ